MVVQIERIILVRQIVNHPVVLLVQLNVPHAVNRPNTCKWEKTDRTKEDTFTIASLNVISLNGLMMLILQEVVQAVQERVHLEQVVHGMQVSFKQFRVKRTRLKFENKNPIYR